MSDRTLITTLSNKQGFTFGDKPFFKHIISPLDSMNFADYDQLKKELDAICKSENGTILKGLSPSDTIDGWDRFPREYSFSDESHYHFKKLFPPIRYQCQNFANCIHALYLNLKNPSAKELIDDCVANLIVHEGHYGTSAQVLASNAELLISDHILSALNCTQDQKIFSKYKIQLLKQGQKLLIASLNLNKHTSATWLLCAYFIVLDPYEQNSLL